MVSLDGFRYDYLEKHDAKNLQKIAKNGVHVKRLIPSNPTKTFPNHYSLVTGLYPDNHGLIGNYFYAPDIDKEYSLKNRESVEDGRFYGGEPIWNTARKAGLKSASYFWVGTEAKIDGWQPDIWKKYNHGVSFEQRIDSVISWLKLPKTKRPRLVLLYFHQPDGAGHKYGPNSHRTRKAVQYVDHLMGVLYNRLMQLPIAKQINLIITADHGMREISEDRQIILSDYIKKDWIVGTFGNNPVYTIKTKEGKKESVYLHLKEVINLNVFKRGKAPKKLHLANNINTNDIIVIPKPGYSLFESPRKRNKNLGAHGYLNTDKQMSALFIAVGSAFKHNYKQNTIKNIDVYNLLTHILDIKAAPNDGNFNRVKSLLKK